MSVFLPSVRLFSILKFTFIYFFRLHIMHAFQSYVWTKCKGENIKIKSLATPYNHSLKSSTATRGPQIKRQVTRWPSPVPRRAAALGSVRPAWFLDPRPFQRTVWLQLARVHCQAVEQRHPIRCQLLSSCGREHMLWIKWLLSLYILSNYVTKGFFRFGVFIVIKVATWVVLLLQWKFVLVWQ